MAAHIEHAERAIEATFGKKTPDTRSLQSIACYLGVLIDGDKSDRHRLKTEIGCYLHAHPITPQQNQIINQIAIKSKTNPGVFDFLLGDYGVKLIVSKINDFGIFDYKVNESVFYRDFDIETTLNYLSDSSPSSLLMINQKINALKINLESMSIFKKKFEWFDCKEKISSAIDHFSKHPRYGIQVKDKDDLEIFFYNNNVTEDTKNIVFKKISSLYSNRKFRENTTRKQCNFSIDIKTIEFIDTLAKNHRISRSELLERFFHSRNAASIKSLIKLE